MRRERENCFGEKERKKQGERKKNVVNREISVLRERWGERELNVERRGRERETFWGRAEERGRGRNRERNK